MKLPKISIGRLMFDMAILGVTFGILLGVMRGRPMADLGLWPSLVAFGSATFAILRDRTRHRPFLRGFAAVGWASGLAYMAVCLWMPGVILSVVQYYLNEVHYWWIVWLNDSDITELYALNLLFIGLILATPQLMMATLGGLLVRWVWGSRWNTT